MAKAKSIYSCTECGGQVPKWQGQCPHCMAWNTLVEALPEAASTHRYAGLAQASKLQRLSEVEAQEVPRQHIGSAEFDRVLGGGLVEGAVVLSGGDPGMGECAGAREALCHAGRR